MILSPFKPGMKNVTAQDVASSLYYIHYELPTTSSAIDLQPPRALHDDAGSRSGSDGHSEKSVPIPRKPLPQTANPITSPPNDHAQLDRPPPPPPHGEDTLRRPYFDANVDRRPLPYESYIHPALRARAGSASKVEGVPPPPPHEPKTLLTPSIIERKPLPGRPRQTSHASLADEKSEFAEVRFSSMDGGYRNQYTSAGSGRQLPPLPKEHYEAHEPRFRADCEDGPRPRTRTPSPYKQSSPGKRSPIKQQTGPTFNLTLIRRDPGSGHQWNIGNVVSQHPTLSTSPHHSHSYPTIDLRIENTGYDKFRGTTSARVNAEDAAAALRSLTGQDNGRSSFSREDVSQLLGGTSAASPPGIFVRRVEMGYYKSWTASLKDKIQQIDKQGWKASGKNLIKGRPISMEGHSDAEQTALARDPSDLAGMKPRGYTFTSPWSGQCEFVTGPNGRSLKCLHTLQDSGSFNPLVGQANGEENDEDSHSTKGPSHIVSELRFNLPRADKSSHNHDALGPNSSAQKVKGHFSKLLGQDSMSSNSDDEDFDDNTPGAVSPFEMNLGAEKAGGGKGGKRAKLGKLIIYGEGLKMLDLVVAANIGVWWGAWERSQSD